MRGLEVWIRGESAGDRSGGELTWLGWFVYGSVAASASARRAVWRFADLEHAG